MSIFKPWTWFKKQSVPTAQEPVSPKHEEEPEFTTDLSRELAMKSSVLAREIESRAFQKTHYDFVEREEIKEGAAMDGQSVAMDSAVKTAFSLCNTTISLPVYNYFAKQGFIGYQACAILAQNSLINKACTKPAERAIKKGFHLTVNNSIPVDNDTLAYLTEQDTRFKITDNLVEFEKFKRVFGIRIALFVVESQDPNYYEKPFNIDGVRPGSYKGISQIDPYWVAPELGDRSASDPASIDFYEPTWWVIAGKRYHKSHLVVSRYSDVPDILKPSYYYGGLPLPQLIYERAYSAERLANEGPILALTKRMNVLKTDIKKALANQQQFEDRLLTVNQFRDNFGVFAIDSKEEYAQLDTALGGLEGVINNQYHLVAALAGMPVTELLETSPGGFNSVGEFEQQSFYDTLRSIQRKSFNPLLSKHYELLLKSEKPLEDTFTPTITWDELDPLSETDKATINLSKAQTDQILLNSGAIDNAEIRNRLIADEDSGYNELEPIEDDEEDQGDL